MQKVLGYRLAHRAVCPEHCAPFDFLTAAYFDEFSAAVVEGARRSGKTRLLSILHQLNCRFKPKLETAHVGGTLAQAQRCYGYTQEYSQIDVIKSMMLGESTMRQTCWRNGSRLYILPGTEAAVSGPHPHRAVGDEVDHWPWRVYQLALGMPTSDDRYPAQQIWTSARRTSYGTMTRIINEGRSKGIPFFSWCVYDTMEPCPDCEDATLVERGMKSEPRKCPLYDAGCEGRVRKATGHMKKLDVLNSYLSSDTETWNIQYLLKKASPAGLVYANWSEQSISLDAEYNPEWPVVWGMDEGFEAPNVCLLLQQTPSGDVHLFDMLYVRHYLVDAFLELLHQDVQVEMRTEQQWVLVDPETSEERGPYKKPQAAYIDPTAKEMQGQVARLGIPVITPANVGRLQGVGIVRRLICSANGHRSLLVHPRCKPFIAEVETYHKIEIAPGLYSEEPGKDTHGDNPDHAMDAVRYYAAAAHLVEGAGLKYF